VLFATASVRPKAHADGMPVLRFMGDVVGALLAVLVVPVAILVVGTPVVLAARLVLWSLGLL
jgi:hypothetical protein